VRKHVQTDGAACLALWKNNGRVNRRRPGRPPEPPTAFSPVCEPLGGTRKIVRHPDEQQLLYETRLEAASNY
jgi:hypothetical protein